MNILVTGGAGYIGSHATQRLLRDGHRVTVLDSLVRGHQAPIRLLQREFGDRLSFVQCDIGDGERVEQVLREARTEAVMHFAALAYVGESVDDPLRYYRANASGALSLIEACARAGVTRFVFSSTCATYGEPDATFIPIPETCPQSPINPYGRSKLHVEHMLFDLAHACARAKPAQPFGFAALRYFNVAGCDRSGVLGEDHRPETHLIPRILHTLLGHHQSVTVFGTDYPTPDGTCIRDYVHVEDLVDAHVKVLGALRDGDARTYNLGIGHGYSVKEVIASVERVTGKKVPVVFGERRAGDPPKLFANPAKVEREVGWRAQVRDIDDIVRSAWRWHERHPHGYE